MGKLVPFATSYMVGRGGKRKIRTTFKNKQNKTKQKQKNAAAGYKGPVKKKIGS